MTREELINDPEFKSAPPEAQAEMLKAEGFAPLKESKKSKPSKSGWVDKWITGDSSGLKQGFASALAGVYDTLGTPRSIMDTFGQATQNVPPGTNPLVDVLPYVSKLFPSSMGLEEGFGALGLPEASELPNDHPFVNAANRGATGMLPANSLAGLALGATQGVIGEGGRQLGGDTGRMIAENLPVLGLLGIKGVQTGIRAGQRKGILPIRGQGALEQHLGETVREAEGIQGALGNRGPETAEALRTEIPGFNPTTAGMLPEFQPFHSQMMGSPTYAQKASYISRENADAIHQKIKSATPSEMDAGVIGPILESATKRETTIFEKDLEKKTKALERLRSDMGEGRLSAEEGSRAVAIKLRDAELDARQAAGKAFEDLADEDLDISALQASSGRMGFPLEKGGTAISDKKHLPDVFRKEVNEMVRRYAKRDEEGKIIKGEPVMVPKTEITAFRSNLLEAIRQNRKQGLPSKNERFLQELLESIDNEEGGVLSNYSDVDAYSAARAKYREYMSMYHNGITNKLFKKGLVGELTVPDTTVIKHYMSKPEYIDEFQKLFGKDQDALAAVQAHFLEDMTKRQNAETWLKTNKAKLEKFPEVQERLTKIAELEKGVKANRAGWEKIQSDYNRELYSGYMGVDPDQTTQQIMAISDPNKRVDALRSLIRRTKMTIGGGNVPEALKNSYWKQLWFGLDDAGDIRKIDPAKVEANLRRLEPDLKLLFGKDWKEVRKSADYILDALKIQKGADVPARVGPTDFGSGFLGMIRLYGTGQGKMGFTYNVANRMADLIGKLKPERIEQFIAETMTNYDLAQSLAWKSTQKRQLNTKLYGYGFINSINGEGND